MNPFSAFGKSPPGLQKGFRRFRFRRGGSHPADASVRGPIVRVACCRFGHGPLRGGLFSRPPPPSPVPLFSRQALPSSSVPSRPASWSVPAAGRAGHDLSHGLKARRYSCSFVLRRQDALKGARDSPNFGCPELSGETAPDAEVVCPAKTAPCASLIGAASSFCSDRRGVPFRRADAPPSLPSRAFPLHPSATVACGLPCSVLVAAASRRLRL